MAIILHQEEHLNLVVRQAARTQADRRTQIRVQAQVILRADTPQVAVRQEATRLRAVVVIHRLQVAATHHRLRVADTLTADTDKIS